jgi:uncharacterized membrane protein YagU involved in acid resistance
MDTSTSTRSAINWRAAILAGLFSGLVFLILEMAMVPLFLDGSPWGPPRMIGAILLGEGVLPPPATFNFGVVVVALIVHFVLSVGYAIALGFLLHRMGVGMGAALGIGAVFGIVLYLVNFYGFTAIFAWFANARNWVSIFAHVVFGIAAAWGYERWAPSQPPS